MAFTRHRKLLASAAVFAAALWGGARAFEAFAAQAGQGEDSAYPTISVFTRALQLVRQDYVDEKKVSYHDLIYSALRGMLSALDPHSQFLDPSAFKGIQDDARSQFGGLGIVVGVRDGTLTIITPMEDSPGMRAGLLPGDEILKINGNPADKIDLSQAIDQLRGSPGEKVTLTIMRPSTREIKDYEIERAVIKVDSVKDAHLLGANMAGNFKIGYVRINQFNEPTADDLRKELAALEAQGMQALILDLRFNPGGLLNSAVDVCGVFLPANQMVVYTEGRTAAQKRLYRTPESGAPHRTYPMAVIVNAGSASSAEIVTGALKDLKRAVVVGETTFGKGSVQSVVQLPDGSGLRLTTAKYYTPGRQVIHEKGITPNIKAIMSDDEERELVFQWRDEIVGEFERREMAKFRDTQLERAADALKGAMLYPGRKTATPAGEPAKQKP